MKKNLVRTIGIALFGMLLMSHMSIGQARSDGGGRLDGTWDAQVNITNCATGDVIATFASIASFMTGGTSIGSTSGIPQSARTPEHGIWRHDGGRNYRFKFKSFSFNMNVFSGWAIVEHQLTLNSSADAYTSSGTATFYAPNGVQVGAGCSEAVGTRMAF